MRTFSCEIIAENSKFAAKKFANQNEVYFDKSLKEFKLGNSRIPKAKIPPHPGPADVKQKTALNKKIAKFYIFKFEFLKNSKIAFYLSNQI